MGSSQIDVKVMTSEFTEKYCGM